jgi:uncharacterized membrane protein
MSGLVDELVEIAARALSPGVNEPFTAISCIDWLGAALIDLSAMSARPARLRDKEGRVRPMIPRLGFADYVQTGIGQLRPHAAKDPNVGAHLVRTLDRVREAVANARHRALIGAEQDRITRLMNREQAS